MERNMNIKDINTAIMFGTWDNTELSSMIDAVKWNRAQLGKSIKNSIRIGDNVNFTSSKTGQNITGVVIKIAIKYVTVKTAQGQWKVPANMLTVDFSDFVDNFASV
jgi:Fic family protein|tara:strand:- start:1150 stop:1467 length:318 start_codon:yes stop_codon:yes gene_type:complete